ncbi:MAG TPA: hypothetical protein VM709_02470 [Candidatus Sulfotelmatobacter sp.]|nr:hypothetical protein [Candidatus Sulfotelmatobacter sp.]
MFRDPVLTAQCCNEICWITPLAMWAQRKVLATASEVPFTDASAAATAHGLSGLSETVLLMGSEESEFTQTTV